MGLGAPALLPSFQNLYSRTRTSVHVWPHVAAEASRDFRGRPRGAHTILVPAWRSTGRPRSSFKTTSVIVATRHGHGLFLLGRLKQRWEVAESPSRLAREERFLSHLYIIVDAVPTHDTPNR